MLGSRSEFGQPGQLQSSTVVFKNFAMNAWGINLYLKTLLLDLLEESHQQNYLPEAHGKSHILSLSGGESGYGLKSWKPMSKDTQQIRSPNQLCIGMSSNHVGHLVVSNFLQKSESTLCSKLDSLSGFRISPLSLVP